jgi:hypothetical protein
MAKEAHAVVYPVANMRLPTALTALIIATAGCSTPSTTSPTARDTNQIPAYLAARQSCAVVMGGVGSRFDDQRVGNVWHEANRQIAGYLHEILSHEGYRVVKLIAPPNGTRDRVISAVTESLAQNQCNRVIQVSHLVGEDGGGRFFQFSVSLQHLEPSKDKSANATVTPTVTVGDYNRDYRYPRTGSSLDAFHTGTFANEAYRDLRKSGALQAVLRGG